MSFPAIFQNKTIIESCKLCIENKMFYLANSMINGLVYNLFNISSFNNEFKNILTPKIKGTYIILLETNGIGHFTQMKELIKLLKDDFKCIGIIAGNFREDVDIYSKQNEIALLNLEEPEFVKEQRIDYLINEAIRYILRYSFLDYEKISKFVSERNPNFFINLHLPIKLMTCLTQPVFNISTQNRLNFENDYDKIMIDETFDKFSKNAVLFSSYMIHNSNLRLHKIAIDCEDVCDKNHLTIPPLISNFENISQRSSNIIVCYFNIIPSISIYNIMSQFKNINFRIFLDVIPEESFLSELSDNILIKKVSSDFHNIRKNCLGVISSCGVETIYENFKLSLPMICIPSNSEQLFNAYDHERKVPGFLWTHQLNSNHIDWIINFNYSTEDLEKHKTFCNYLTKTDVLSNYIKSVI